MTLNFGIPLSREGEIIEKDPNEIPKEKINIPPAQNLFLTKPDFISSFDFRDVLRGQAYLKFYGGLTRTEEVTKQEYYDTNDDSDESANLYDWVAQTFQVSNDTWTNRIDLYGSDESTVSTYFILCEVDGNGKPDTNNILASDSTTSFTAGDTWQDFTFGFVKLNANTTYAIVTFYGSGGNDFNWRTDSSSPTYSNGSVFNSADSGATWTANTSKDALFRIYGFTTNPYILFPEQFDSNTISTSAPLYRPRTQDGTFFKRQDIDFDLKVGVTMVLEGKAIIEFTTQDNEGESSASYYNIIKLKKDDGTTETLIATGQGETYNMSGSANERRQSIILDITTKTKIVKGDIIRLSIETWVESDGDLTTLQLFHDPTSRVTYSIDIVSNDGENSNSGKKSDLTIFLPFKV